MNHPTPLLGFVLTQDAAVDIGHFLQAAANLGLPLKPGDPSNDTPTFEFPTGGFVMLAAIDAPHPDAPNMPMGPMAPTPEDIAGAHAHVLVTVMGVEGNVSECDRTLARLLAATIHATTAVAAMMGDGKMFVRAPMFADLAEDDGVPAELVVDITAAPEPDERMSFLTHGLVRYGREEFYITCPVDGTGGWKMASMLTRWMITDPSKELPTGDTIGLTADQKLVVQRVPNPTGDGPEVIRLDMP